MNAVAVAAEAPPAAPPCLADRVGSCIAGCLAAQRLLHDIRGGHAHPDALLDALLAEVDRGDRERLRGFAREVAKAIERCGEVAA